MGLDMYAMVTSEAVDGEVDFKVEEATELHYWRKHPNLHGWMALLYHLKGGSCTLFNCVPVVLTLRDLDVLEECVLNDELPLTVGFFFGESDGSEREDDLAFIEKARAEIRDGKTVFYNSWW